MTGVDSEITIRAAEPGEAAIITGHRRAMFAEIRPTPARPVYDVLGFRPTNEMRLMLDAEQPPAGAP